jgi:hypothetical protein
MTVLIVALVAITAFIAAITIFGPTETVGFLLLMGGVYVVHLVAGHLPVWFWLILPVAALVIFLMKGRPRGPVL